MMKILFMIAHGMRKVLVWILILPILFYQKCITPYTPPSCRFQPTCSEYARQAILKHGPFKGLALAVWRILRSRTVSFRLYCWAPYTYYII